MQIDRLILENFRCFGGKTRIDFDPELSALVGANGTGKTAAMQALLRLFGLTAELRRIVRQDFHFELWRRSEPPTN